MIRRNIFLEHADPLPNIELALDVARTQSLALKAIPHIQSKCARQRRDWRNSTYIKWILQFMEQEERWELRKYARLRDRLVRFWEPELRAMGEEI